MTWVHIMKQILVTFRQRLSSSSHVLVTPFFCWRKTMYWTKLRKSLGVVMAAAIVGTLVGVTPRPSPAQEKEPVGLAKAEFDRLLKQLNLKNQAWATIPWKNTLPEARAQAVKENKPIFMVVNTGNCLGFV